MNHANRKLKPTVGAFGYPVHPNVSARKLRMNGKPSFRPHSVLSVFRTILTTKPVAAQSEEQVCGHWLGGTAGSNPAGDTDVCPCECRALYGPILRPGEGYRSVRVCH